MKVFYLGYSLGEIRYCFKLFQQNWLPTTVGKYSSTEYLPADRQGAADYGKAV